MENMLNKKDCVIFQTTDFIGKKWTLLVLLELSKGSEWKRYSELKRALNKITPKMLSARLHELSSEGLIEKKVTTTQVPIRSEYALTKSGKEFLVVLDQIKKWAIKNKNPDSLCKDKNCRICKN